MTRAEVEARKEALEIILIAQEGYASEARIAERLLAWQEAEAIRCAKACLHVAKDWRTNPCGDPMSDQCMKLRYQAAESAELCAGRIHPETKRAAQAPGLAPKEEP